MPEPSSDIPLSAPSRWLGLIGMGDSGRQAERRAERPVVVESGHSLDGNGLGGLNGAQAPFKRRRRLGNDEGWLTTNKNAERLSTAEYRSRSASGSRH